MQAPCFKFKSSASKSSEPLVTGCLLGISLARVVINGRGPGIFSSYYLESGPWQLLLENRRKIEPKEIPSCLIPRLLVVFTRQLEILVTTLLALLQAEPLFVFQLLMKEEKRRLCLNCVKSLKSSQQPKLLYSQSFFSLVKLVL